MNARALVGGAMVAASLLGGCAFETAPAGRTSDSTRPAPTQKAPSASQASVDPAQVERLKRVMIPLIQVMNKPKSPSQVKVGIIDDPSINAANAGNGEFYVTTGLLQKASDDQLLAVMAHEVAHDDLGHVAKAQALGTGIGIGAVILDQIIPGAGRVAPIAGALIQRKYSRSEEYEADAHGVDLLKRVGRNKDVMINTLTWLMSAEGGGGGGGFLSTHPDTGDRIDVLRKL
ncbi:MAG TPA: M48 family metallopeptidase [Candidatus Eisenbacteria bacterium]|jgi:Zn-dependent protease with chaperone function|nr:M48 family metallopeptidase [Candidatus Eisenbacteria bacterium]